MRRLASLMALLWLTGCAATRVVDSWKDPSVQGPLKFKKVVVMTISKDESVRRITEDEVVTKIGPERAVASHTFINTADLKDTNRAQEEVRKQGADGLITMRLLDKSQEVNYTPGVYTPTASALWGPGYSRSYTFEPGVVTTDTIVRVETNIYSADDEKLLWSGVSETFNPRSAKGTAMEVADAVRKTLIKQNLLEVKK